MNTHAIRAREVTKQFGSGNAGTLALRGADFDARFGEITMLVGPSGCGKTTLLSIVAGLLDRTSGHLDVLDTDPARLGDRERVLFRRRHLGFIFQQYNLIPSLTAAENAAVPLLAAGAPRKQAVARASELLVRLGLEQRLASLPSQLSGGQQQRVAVARALVHDPHVVLCDEPTAALDAQAGHAVMEMMAAVAVRADRAVVVVTHDNRIHGFARRIVHMEDGRVTRAEEPPAATG